jgi:hypothetical protein
MLRRAPWIAAGLIATASLGACSHNRDIYDSGFNDHHRWDSHEEAAYRRWEVERQMQHADYSRRSADDQRSYWAWRHQHPG